MKQSISLCGGAQEVNAKASLGQAEMCYSRWHDLIKVKYGYGFSFSFFPFQMCEMCTEMLSLCFIHNTFKRDYCFFYLKILSSFIIWNIADR